jgi:diguanylate cyclase (GGDEF)-like protein
VEGTSSGPTRSYTTDDRRIRRTWWLFAAGFAALAIVAVIRAVVVGPGPVDALLLGLVALVGLAALLNRLALVDLETSRRAEADGVARLLRGLSRSVSPDAIVGAIAGELASSVDADHVVVVRRRTDPPRLEATLVSARPGIPSATTSLPLSAIDPAAARPPRPIAVAAESEMAVAAMARAGIAEQAFEPRPPGGGLRLVRDAEGGEALDPGSVDASPGPDDLVERIAARASEAFGLRHTLAAPLVVDGAVVGALVLSRRTSAAWPPSTRRLLDEAATESSVALARAYSHRAAELRASTDALTGLPNRRYFDEFCGLLARRRRSGDAVGVMMVDIDRFKRLNDTRGHAVGDEVLRAVAGAIAGAVREDDVPARYGGEEFAVLLRNPSRDVAVEIGERVRAAVGALDLRTLGVPTISVSVGVAVQDAPDQPISELVEAADQALYRAKRTGRDRVVAA